jgi:hypothetical protein
LEVGAFVPVGVGMGKAVVMEHLERTVVHAERIDNDLQFPRINRSYVPQDVKFPVDILIQDNAADP